jgi:transposase InsO family protein
MVLAILEQGVSPASAAAHFGVSPATASKWLGRYQQGGPDALEDASSRPRRQPRRTTDGLRRKVGVLRRRRLTIQAIAVQTGLSKATVSRILRQAGLNRLSALEPKDPPRRYQREHPGELIHLDIKKFGRIERVGHRIHGDRSRRVEGAGWEFLHVCIDDASRLAYAEVLADERKESAAGFLTRALAFFRTHRITVQRLMTDNGSCYRSKLFARLCTEAGIRHIFTKPYTPQTNGKAERFIQSACREWAYAHSYRHSSRRIAQLPKWLHHYNWHRPHHALNLRPPALSLPLSRKNLLRLHS